MAAGAALLLPTACAPASAPPPHLSDAAWSSRARAAIDLYALADRSLERDLLSARAGLLRDLDPIVRDVADAGGSLDDLRSLSREEPGLRAAVDDLTPCLERRRAIVEAFKTDNALLQNSLARVALLGGPGAEGASREQQAFAASVLRLTLDPRPEAVAVMRDSLARLERRGVGREVRGHGELLATVLPAVDRLLLDFRAVPVDAKSAVVRLRVGEAEARRAAGRRAREGLELAAVLLSLALATAGGLVAALRTRRLRRQADAEHLNAKVAAALIDSDAPSLQARVAHALSLLARSVGARRAFLRLAGEPAVVFTWRDPAAPALGDADMAEQEPAGRRPARLLLHAEGGAPGARALMGFDAAGPPLPRRSGLEPGLRAGLTSILHAAERDRLQEERLGLEQSLAEARRLETVGAIASGVAHNFNNILGAISGFGEMAEAHAPAGSAVGKSLAEIRLAVARARSLVEQVLVFGRRSRSPRQPVDLVALLAETQALLAVSLPAAVRLEAAASPAPVMVAADPAGLQQVILNLVHNAAQAMDGAGRVAISLDRRESAGRATLSHGGLSPGAYAVLRVSDDGCGVTAARLPRLFEPFFTTRRGGTGLGLSTAWEIVRDLGGTIDVRSETGVGTTFDVWMPVRPA